MTKLSKDQIEDALLIDTDETVEVDESVYRTSLQRKEIRSNRQREDGEMVGKGKVHKHRKY